MENRLRLCEQARCTRAKGPQQPRRQQTQKGLSCGEALLKYLIAAGLDRCLVHYGLEGIGMVHGEVGKHLAVQGHPCFAQAIDEAAVSRVVESRTSIDTGNPQRAKAAFLGFAVTVGKRQAFFDLIFGYCPHVFLAPEIAFGHFQDFFPPCLGGDCVYATWHSLKKFAAL